MKETKGTKESKETPPTPSLSPIDPHGPNEGTEGPPGIRRAKHVDELVHNPVAQFLAIAPLEREDPLATVPTLPELRDRLHKVVTSARKVDPRPTEWPAALWNQLDGLAATLNHAVHDPTHLNLFNATWSFLSAPGTALAPHFDHPWNVLSLTLVMTLSMQPLARL